MTADDSPRDPEAAGATGPDAESFFETAGLSIQPGSDTASGRSAPGSGGEGPGTVIGRYTLIEEIGSGGFGAVFAAEQRVPVARRVALKILKLGMDTQTVIARFEQERQALALMDHPHIAKVLDAGTTELGRPFFVMELVEGQPITEYADEHQLTVRQRLELFGQVCHAIQHAHLKGIIHRDIKPSNVLVSTHDGKPFAKVIDFGIAKAIEQRLSEETLLTHIGQLIGTPLYMSPEQAEGNLDIDTRTDVYSLGVLLYELLTGTTPLDPLSLRTAALAEMHRLIREVDPPRPSTRLAAATQSAPTVAKSRNTAPEKLTSTLRGELDWIAMKALEKDRRRRYETANGLARDVELYLAGEPVEAAPPSAGYRLRKLVSRHRGLVTGVATVVVALVAGLAGTLWQAGVAAQQRDTARQEAARATALNAFMTEMLVAADPMALGNREVTVAEVLERASTAAGANLGGQPQAEAAARTLLGTTFQSLGKIDQAVDELQRALALHRGEPGPPSLERAGTLVALGRSLGSRGEYAEAVPLLEEAVSILVPQPAAAGTDLVAAYWELATAELRRSRFDEAQQAIDRADQALSQLGDLPKQRGLNLMVRGGLEQYGRGNLKRAAELYAAGLVQYRRTGERHLVADGLNSVGVAKMALGELDSAATLIQESADLRVELYGEENPFVAAALENLANVRYRQGDYRQAADLLRRVLAIREPVFGADSFPVAKTRFNTGVVTMKAGDYQRALELIDGAIVLFRAHTGDRSVEMVGALRSRGQALEGLGDDNGAMAAYRQALSIADNFNAPASPDRLMVLQAMAVLHCRLGATAAGRGTVNLALAALDAADPGQAKWLGIFQELLKSCGHDGAGG